MANIYKNQKKDLTTNTVTTLYSVPSNSRAIVKSILVCDATEQLLNEPLIMQESEVLQVTAADANRLHVVASILEINREDK